MGEQGRGVGEWRSGRWEGVGESGWTAVRLSPMTHLGFLSILNEQAESPGPNTALARKLVDDLGLG